MEEVIKQITNKSEAIEMIRDPPEGFFISSDEHADVVNFLMNKFKIKSEDFK